MCPKNQNISLRTTNSIRIMRNPQSSLPCPTQGAIVFYFLLFLPPVQKHLCVLTQLRFPYEITVFVSTTKDPVLHLKEKLFVKEQLPKAERTTPQSRKWGCAITGTIQQPLHSHVLCSTYKTGQILGDNHLQPGENAAQHSFQAWNHHDPCFQLDA